MEMIALDVISNRKKTLAAGPADPDLISTHPALVILAEKHLPAHHSGGWQSLA